jgi:hypothetical protein
MTWKKLGLVIALATFTIGIAEAQQWVPSGTNTYFNTGNVGIGTTSPQYKLHLWSTDLTPVFYIDANDSYLSYSRHFLDLKAKSTFNQVPYISWTTPSGVRQAFLGWRTDSFGLTLENGYNFSINGGNVGIGTTTPESTGKLTIDAGYNDNAKQGLYVKATAGTNDSGPALILHNLASWEPGRCFIRGISVTASGPVNTDLTLYNGRVGINTNYPDASLAVNGDVHAKEVKVDLNFPGPDYVFESDYKLLSLEQIHQYVQEHKHLPEVPSAKEMEQNGINLSEMNMLLLKKVEELTLHLIALKDENAQQQKEIELLKNR